MKSIYNLYEASLLDIDGTIKSGDTILDNDKLVSKLMSSSSEKEFNDTLNKLIINIKSTFKKFEADDLNQYYSNKFDKTQIFIALIKDTRSFYEHFKDSISYCNAIKSGRLYWNGETKFKKWNGAVNVKGIMFLKNNVDDYCRGYDFYMVPKEVLKTWKDLMKNRK